MKFLIIVPTHNEESNILQCLESLAVQDFKDFEVVVVNDGSTDSTQILVEKFIKNQPNFELLNLQQSSHQPGAKVVKTFNKGLETKTLSQFEVVCKYDADIIFPKDYLSRVNKAFVDNPKAGMISGLVYIQNENKEWIFENLSSKNHVRGPIKAYRITCFNDMKGLRPVLGWDNIDVMLAQKAGWEVVTIKHVWVKHLRPTAYKYKNQKSEKLGEYFYNIGLNLPLAFVASAKSSFKNKSFQELIITIKSFLKQKHQRQLSNEEIAYIRELRWKEMFKKLKI